MLASLMKGSEMGALYLPTSLWLKGIKYIHETSFRFRYNFFNHFG